MVEAFYSQFTSLRTQNDSSPKYSSTDMSSEPPNVSSDDGRMANRGDQGVSSNQSPPVKGSIGWNAARALFVETGDLSPQTAGRFLSIAVDCEKTNRGQQEHNKSPGQLLLEERFRVIDKLPVDFNEKNILKNKLSASYVKAQNKSNHVPHTLLSSRGLLLPRKRPPLFPPITSTETISDIGLQNNDIHLLPTASINADSMKKQAPSAGSSNCELQVLERPTKHNTASINADVRKKPPPSASSSYGESQLQTEQSEHNTIITAKPNIGFDVVSIINEPSDVNKLASSPVLTEKIHQKIPPKSGRKKNFSWKKANSHLEPRTSFSVTSHPREEVIAGLM